jgi:hypothetical protein
MNKVKSLGMVLVNSKVVARDLEDWSQVVDALYDFLKENPEEVGGRVEFVSYVARLDNFENEFEVSHEPGYIDLGDLCYRSSNNDGTYRVDDYDKEFDDEDEIRRWLERMVKDGELDFEEAKNLEITYIEETEGNTFDDATMEGESFSVELNSVSSSIADHFGFTFVLASEAEKEIQETGWSDDQIKNAIDKELSRHDLIVMRSPGVMTVDEMDDEMKLLQERMFALQLEKKHRHDIKHGE